jgi:hypothetical protein
MGNVDVPGRASWGDLRTAVQVLVVCGVLVPGARAFAVPAPSPPSWALVNADIPIVQDGVLLFSLYASNPKGPNYVEPVLEPRVQNAEGRFVAGAVENLTLENLTLDGATAFAIYRFDSTLSADGMYSLKAGGKFATGGPFVDAPLASRRRAIETWLQPSTLACAQGRPKISALRGARSIA